jgi:hypothetical protein
LWVIDNGATATTIIWGYTAEQIAATFDGPPAVTLSLAGFGGDVGIGHSLAVLSDGALVAAHSEGAGRPQTEEGWTYIPESYTHRSRTLSSGAVIDRDCGTITDPAGQTGARHALELPDGQILLGREFYARTSRSALTGVGIAGASVFLGSDGGAGAVIGWDTECDAAGNVWQSGGNTLWRVPGLQSAAATPIPIDKIMKGANVAADAGCIAFDALGGVWIADAAANVIRYHSAANVAALTAIASNPAPTRSLSSLSFASIFALALDASGAMWVGDYTSPGRLYYFSTAQMAAGGAQVPSRTITLPGSWPVAIRFSPGNGLHLR